MLRFLKNLGISAKIALLGMGGVLLIAIALLWMMVWQSGRYHTLAQSEVEALIEANLDQITQGIFNLVQAENDAFHHQVEGNLLAARYLLEGAGRLSLSEIPVSWRAINQFTGVVGEISLPQLLLGNTLISPNDDFGVPTPVVDQAASLTRETVTIFQRMNEQGDMLRVATNVKTTDGKRAIGTYIPATGPDGQPNPVIARVLKGERYLGRAYVVNDWYLTAYEPIFDARQTLIGMLYVGTQQRNIEARVRQVILQTRVGKTGYVYIIGATGETRGRYIVSQQGIRDGEDIWSNQDSDGRFIIQEIISKAQALRPGEMTTYRYRWLNPGEKEPRWQVARLAYFEPWNWVIGTSVYEDELQSYRTVLEDGRGRLIWNMMYAGLIIIPFIGIACLVLARSIAHPIQQMTRVVGTIMQGDLEQTVEIDSGDEVGRLGQTFNRMTGKLKQLMEQLRQQEEEYRRIFEDAPEGIFQTTVEGVPRKVNPAMARMLHVSNPEEALQYVSNDQTNLFVDPNDRGRLLTEIRENGKVSEFEVRLRRGDGSLSWFAISARPIVDTAGKTMFMQGFMVDISGRRQAEEDLRRINTLLKTQQETSPDGILMVDAQGSVVSFNHRFVDMWHLPPDFPDSFPDQASLKLIGSRIEKSAEFLQQVQNLNRQGSEKSFGEIRTTDDQIFEHYSAPIIGPDGTFYGRVWYFRDVTERKKAEERRKKLEGQLLHAQKIESIGLLAGGIAHDFNNLLTPILGYAEMLKDSFSHEDEQMEMLQTIWKAADRAKDLARQLLAFSRKQVLEIKRINLGTVVASFEKILRRTIRENIQITLSVMPRLHDTMADIGQIEQILMNLAVNAQDAMPGGGELSVTVSNTVLGKEFVDQHGEAIPGQYVLLEISDTGSGIDPAVQPHVFEPFFTTKGIGKGTGLGLSTVYGIVKQHEGHITLYTEPGHGTTFRIYLPALDEEPGLSERTEAAASLASRKPVTETILVVEDSDLVRQLACKMLQSLGYQVLEASGGAAGMALVTEFKGPIHLLLSDVILPGMNGKQIYDRLRALRPDLKVLFMSGYPQNVIAHHGILDEGTNYLSKPFSLQRLAEKVREVLDAC